MDKLIESFPAYDIFEREVSTYGDAKGCTEIRLGDKLGLQGNGYYKTFTPGSVASYALQYNECPMKAIARAMGLGHKLHWLNQDATVISASPRAKEKLIRVRDGMRLYFQGIRFIVRRAPNDNLDLVIDTPVPEGM